MPFRLRYSLRTLLVVVTIVAVGFGLVAMAPPRNRTTLGFVLVYIGTLGWAVAWAVEDKAARIRVLCVFLGVLLVIMGMFFAA